jgi:hypothetical protein
VLNSHYAAISNDANYTAPSVKDTANNLSAATHIIKLRLFKVLDTLRPTATGLDNIPAWFLRIGAPFFTAPLADLMNLSLSSSAVAQHWKLASILPIPKISTPLVPSDYRLISITSVVSRILERIVVTVTDYVYPSLSSPLPVLTFSDQFACQLPTGSITVALIHLLHTICFTVFSPLHEIIITNYGIVPVTIFSFLSVSQLFVTVIF